MPSKMFGERFLDQKPILEIFTVLIRLMSPFRIGFQIDIGIQSVNLYRNFKPYLILSDFHGMMFHGFENSMWILSMIFRDYHHFLTLRWKNISNDFR